MDKAISRGILALLTCFALMLALPALSFADTDSEGGGGGESLSDFGEDFDWENATLSFDPSSVGIYADDCNYDDSDNPIVRPWYVDDDLSLQAQQDEGDAETINSDYYYIEDEDFYQKDDSADSGYSSVGDNGYISETGDYYLKVILDNNITRYVPLHVEVSLKDSKDLSLYTTESSPTEFWVGDDIKPSNVLFLSPWCYTKSGKLWLSESAYTIDSSWYWFNEDEEDYEKISGQPSKEGDYAIKLVAKDGSGYHGEMYVGVDVCDDKCATGFETQKQQIVYTSGMTVKDLDDSLVITNSLKNGTETLERNKAYKVTGWEVYTDSNDEEEDGTWSSVNLGDALTAGTWYRPLVEPISPYYGEPYSSDLEIKAVSTSNLSDYSFDIAADRNLVFGYDDLTPSKIATTAVIEDWNGEIIAKLEQGKDYAIDNTWYKYSWDEEKDAYVYTPTSVAESGAYYCLKATGLGAFSSQDPEYIHVYIENANSLYAYDYDCNDLYWDNDNPENLSIDKIGFKVSLGDIVLTRGTDYDICWSYNNDNEGNWVDFDAAYPTSGKYDYAIHVTGKGKFSGQDLHYQVDINGKSDKKEDCDHRDVEEIYATEATCTEDGYTAGYKCEDCGAILLAPKKTTLAFGHTLVESKPAVAATYSSTGLTAEKTCITCKQVIEKQTATPKLSAKSQSITVKTSTKSVKKAKVKKKAQVVSSAIKVKNAQGKVSYAKVSGSGKLKVNASNGKITVKKKTKKGTYTIKVRVKVDASTSGEYLPATKTVKVKVKVK
ncbi:MAG: hypothetical protein Q4A43_05400 [Coriobacteriia bacterium]|nr:hypothetical protein [Coriobacteriia bacterium]